MPLITLNTAGGRQKVFFAPGETLTDALERTAYRPRTGCGGSGTCGLCRVRIEKGSVSDPTKKERIVLSEEELHEGIRLACQVFPEDDLQVRVGDPAAGTGWRKLDPDSIRDRVSPVGSAADFEEGYGVAVDLGTTHISLTLWDLGRGRRLSGRFGLNRQFCFGSDVMTRMVAASRSTDVAGKICGEARRSISDALSDLCSGEGWNPQKVKRISIVGNSPMLAFLAGKNYDLLLSPAYWGSDVDCLARDTKGWFDSAGVDPDVAVDIVQPLAGFIGSDLIAGVIATHLMDKEPGSLLIDFGTNSEIALWDGSDLWTTSAAGGPAFEGGGINCGMPAEPGAIFRIHTGGDFESGPAEPVAEVIGGGEPKGFCGSGLVDAIAYLLRTEQLNQKGKFLPDADPPGWGSRGFSCLLPDERGVDLFQRAKAAIGAGVRILMERARLHAADLRRIYIGGTFGRYLNVQNAKRIGLLPAAPLKFFELCGNTALSGCEFLLLSPHGKGLLKAVKQRSKLINLAQEPGFEELFLENLYLRPMRED